MSRYAVEATAKLVRIPNDLLKQVLDKAGRLAFTSIVNRLLEKWVKGEVSLD